MNPVTLHRLVYVVQIVAVVAASVAVVYSEWWARRNEMNTAGRRRWIRGTPIVLGIVAALVASFLIGGNLDERTIILCRMLFSEKPSSGPHYIASWLCLYLGGTSMTDWPLAPIELVDGVPILIARPTPAINGRGPDEAQPYVRYCVANCDWNPLRYETKTPAEKSAALAKLLASPKWRRPLDAREKAYLSTQIRPLSR